jgi:hypothetical protein
MFELRLQGVLDHNGQVTVAWTLDTVHQGLITYAREPFLDTTSSLTGLAVVRSL